MWKQRSIAIMLLITLHPAPPAPALAQGFTRITSGNPIVTTFVPGTGLYAGCAWADTDSDGDPDLYVVQQGLFRNDGGGRFTWLLPTATDPGTSFGCSFGDYDNDGDPDLFIAGSLPNGSRLLRNDGGNTFTRVTSGPFASPTTLPGWAAAWADYDLDRRLDVVVACPFGDVFPTSNHLLHNHGGDSFTRVDTSVVSAQRSSFTVPTWNDLDGDGAPELFIAAGPLNSFVLRDFLYENRRAPDGHHFFRRITTGALATDFRDSQIYNWVDIDADGDLDVFITNISDGSGLTNDLYRNDGGVFTRLTALEAGDIVVGRWYSLGSAWGDLDNDGDMDCVITNDIGQPNQHLANNGHGFFTLVPGSPLRLAGPNASAALADYDRDGDLDVYLAGTVTTRALFRNDLDSTSTNGWLDVKPIGTTSNTGAIGTRVWVRATIGGVSQRLVQQVSSQNTFNGHNDPVLHFGLGNAQKVDSLIVSFPSGRTVVLLDVAPRRFAPVREDLTVSVPPVTVPTTLLRWIPQPGAAHALHLELSLAEPGDVKLEVWDVTGRRLATRLLPDAPAGQSKVELSESRAWRPGVYWVRAETHGRHQTVRALILS